MRMSFMTNKIFRKNKNKKEYIYIYIYGYLINCEYFNNLNEDENMVGTSIMARIYSSSSPSPYPIEKIGDSPYPYPYPVNAGISRQNGTGSDNTHVDEFICHPLLLELLQHFFPLPIIVFCYGKKVINFKKKSMKTYLFTYRKIEKYIKI